VGPKVGVTALSPAEEQLPGGQALSRAVLPGEYILGPGDGLSVNLWGEYTDQYNVRVTPDGKISLPTIGDLKVKGLTLVEAEALIEREVRRYYRNVKSGLSLSSLRVFEVLVLGEVGAPGTYLATPVKRVSEVVSQASGVRTGGSQRHIQVRKNGKVRATADLAAFLRQGDESVNPFVGDGDVIFVPPMGERRVSVYITEVSTASTTGGGGALTENSVPSVVELQPGERVSTLITEVGGISPWWDLENVLIQRATHAPEGTMRIHVDLRRYFLEKDESQNPVLESGDQVYIPASVRKVLVAGAVKVSGAYPFTPSKPADAYLVMAGGPSLVADLDRSFIKRADGTVEPYIGTTEINNGDSIVILERIFKTYNDYFGLIGSIAGVVVTGVGMLAAFQLGR
jgi:protein involved in polysaccharide export with SLBB domain